MIYLMLRRKLYLNHLESLIVILKGKIYLIACQTLSGQWNSDRNSDSDGSTSDNKGSCAAACVVHEAGGQENGELKKERTQTGNNNASGCGSLMARDPDITNKNVGMTFTPSYEHLLLVLREN